MGATFKILPTTKFIPGIETKKFIPDPSIFRTYKIHEGLKVPLEFTWIQRREKRLLTQAERKSIQRARQQKKKSSII